MEFLGYICAALVGMSLGLLGSGGSILTVPIMVYLMGINPVEATGLSLFVVGAASFAGGISYIRKRLVDVETAIIFAIPSIIAVFLTRRYVMPQIPNPVFSISGFVVSKELLILILFALLMIIVGSNMIRNAKIHEPGIQDLKKYNYTGLILIGLIAGLITGLLGVGGGFIIIPALVLFAKIPVKMSVGTSLLIIAFNSLSGFAEEMLEHHSALNYRFLFLFSAVSVAGIFIGFRISISMRPQLLKKMFGYFIAIMGVVVLIKEIWFPVR